MEQDYGTDLGPAPAKNWANTFESQQAAATERMVPLSRLGRAIQTEQVKQFIENNRVEEAKSTLADLAGQGKVLQKPQSEEAPPPARAQESTPEAGKQPASDLQAKAEGGKVWEDVAKSEGLDDLWKKDAHEISAADYAKRSDDTLDSYVRESHRQAIAMALKEGKTVPASVLAEYPGIERTPAARIAPDVADKITRAAEGPGYLKPRALKNVSRETLDPTTADVQAAHDYAQQKAERATNPLVKRNYQKIAGAIARVANQIGEPIESGVQSPTVESPKGAGAVTPMEAKERGVPLVDTPEYYEAKARKPKRSR
jgi:hypothetical protein